VKAGFPTLQGVRGEAPKWERVAQCALGYREGEVPEGVLMLTCGVDVQKNRLPYCVRGWTKDKTSYLIERGEFWGETDHPEVWRQLNALLERDWHGVAIRVMAIDSGYRPDDVYTFVRSHRGVAIATKGHDRLDKPFYASRVDVNIRGTPAKGGVQLWHFDTDTFKSWVHSHVEWPEGQPGAWYVFQGIDDDYCRQIVAEQRIAKASGKVGWIKVSSDNHYFDAEVLCYLAVRIAGGVVSSARNRQPERQRRQQQPPATSRFSRRGL
jgi:phage terminase large subunit GpA-like protein